VERAAHACLRGEQTLDFEAMAARAACYRRRACEGAGRWQSCRRTADHCECHWDATKSILGDFVLRDARSFQER